MGPVRSATIPSARHVVDVGSSAVGWSTSSSIACCPVKFSSAHTEMLRLHASLAGPIDALVSVRLPEDIDGHFRRFFELLQSHPPVEENAQRTVQRTHDIREGVRAAVYHQRNVEKSERAIVPVCQAAYRQCPPATKPMTMSFGAPGLTAEYHAFLFALRRSFEYLNGALIVYFGRQSKSFRKLPQRLNGAEPTGVASLLAKKVQDALHDFEDVLGRPDARAPRDRVAHWRPEEPAVSTSNSSPVARFVWGWLAARRTFPFPSQSIPPSLN